MAEAAFVNSSDIEPDESDAEEEEVSFSKKRKERSNPPTTQAIATISFNDQFPATISTLRMGGAHSDMIEKTKSTFHVSFRL